VTRIPVVETERLELVPWTLELIDGFLTRDRAMAESALDVTFPEPFGPPPETGDVLDYFRATVASDRSAGAFVPRLIVRREDRLAAGSIGINLPDGEGVAMIGYSIYPSLSGQGHASEAAAALVEWGLWLPGVTVIRATIPVGHTASELVAGRAGLTATGEQVEDEADGMTLNVWERRSD
jgi:RimJ/RimL family protein N-acetyltransferase